MKINNHDIGTIAVHESKRGPASITLPKVAPIYASSVFDFEKLEDIDAVYEGTKKGYIYSRVDNPNISLLENMVAKLEQAEAGAAFSSGMAAIASSILACIKEGDHVVANRVLYGGSYSFLADHLQALGIKVTFTDFSDTDRVKEAITEKTRILYVETISNPLMEVADLPALAEIAKQHGLKLIVDNTFASPYVCNPIALGADVVVHSATKYLNGHSDVTGGIAVGTRKFVNKVKEIRSLWGGCMSPFDAWLVLRGIRTLHLRMREHCSNALKLAEQLSKHPKVLRVNYPGLTEHPQHRLACEILKGGFGGMLSFEVEGGVEGAAKVIEALKLVDLTPSLAGVATTVSHPGKTSHRSLPSDVKDRIGVRDSLIRVSVGIETIDTVIADFEQALNTLTLD